MKKVLAVMNFCAILPSLSFCQETVEVPVWGNCGMCQYRIETTAKAVSGVDTAWWYPSADTLVIRIRKGEKTDDIVVAVCKSVALAGYDNSYYSAPDSSYKSLHGCCKYARPELGKYHCPKHPGESSGEKLKCRICGRIFVPRQPE